jgi:hypothetical protein
LTAVVLPIQDPATIYKEARIAWDCLMKSFENWVSIGKAVVLARKQADESEGRFLEILVDEGIADALGRTKNSIKVCASRLERIMRDLPAIQKWRRDKLNDTQRLHWASPGAICKHYPPYADTKEHRIGDPDQDMPAETLKQTKKHNVSLHMRLANAETMVETMYERGDVFENGSADDIRDYLMKSIEDRERLRDACIAILKSMGIHVRDPNAPPPKKKSGTYWRKKKAEREAAAAEAKQD